MFALPTRGYPRRAVAVRTPIGEYGGGLAPVPLCDLAATVVREAMSRAAVEPDDVGHAIAAIFERI
jgi:hypothetical protein